MHGICARMGSVSAFIYLYFLPLTWRFCVFGLRICARMGRFCHFCTSLISFFDFFLRLPGGSACLDSGFASVWGGSAIFVPAF